MKSDLGVDLKVYECHDVKGNNGNLVLEMKANLKSTFHCILLPKLVLIRPGLFYIVRIGPFSKEYSWSSYRSPYQVTIRYGIVIDFYDNDSDGDTNAYRNYDDDTDEDDSSDYHSEDDGDESKLMNVFGLIRGLWFKQIQM